MAQTRPSPTLSRGFTRLGRFLAPYAVGCGGPRSRWNDSTESSNLAVVQSKVRIAWRTNLRRVMSFGVSRVGPG